MNTKVKIVKQTGAVLLATAALLGVSVGAAVAATPPTHATGTAAVNGQNGDIVFFNATPFTEFVSQVDQTFNHVADLAPGQSVLLTRADLAARGLSSQLEVGSEASGNGWDIDAINTTGYSAGINACTPIAGRGMASELGCLVQTPNVLAGESGPTQISIWTNNPSQSGPITMDAAAPGSDPVAMGNFLSGIAAWNPGWVSFNASQANPISFGTGAAVQAGPAVWNCGQGDASEQIGGDSAHEESTNVTGTFGITQGIKLFDTVDTQISASISVGHTWTSSTSDSHSVSKTVNPENVAWLASIPSTETVVGTVTMSAAPAHPVTFENVSFSEPGVNSTGNPALDYQYVAHSRPMSATEITTYCGGGPAATTSNHVIVGGTVPDVNAGVTR